MITLKHLAHIKAIRDHGTLHGAAQAIHLTHSALARSLQNLEEALGISLFERHKQGMRPTDFCLRIVDQGEQVLMAVKDIQREAELERDLLQGHLHILVGPTTKVIVTQNTIPSFFSVYPNIEVQITEALPDQAYNLLLKREADLIISGAGSFASRENINIEKLIDVPVQALARMDHPLANRPVSVQELFTYPLVAAGSLPDEHPFIQKLATIVSPDVKLRPSVICADNTTLKALLLENDVWMASLCLEMNEELMSGELVSLDIVGLELQNNLSVIELAGRSRSPAANQFVNLLKRHISQLEF